MPFRSDSSAAPANGLPARPGLVASVTVAYNGAETLRKHLDSLKRQTHKLEEIIVVDNASTDDTRHLLSAGYPEITVLPLEENGGIAGGLSAGIAYALRDKKYDWIWLFDQDSVPAADALERLIVAFEQSANQEKRVAVFAPRCFHSDSLTEYPGLRWRGSKFVPVDGTRGGPMTFVDMVITSGSLMWAQAIEAVGLPRKDFFMDFVDYEHCLRLRRHGFRIAIVGDSVVQHAIGSPTTFSIAGRTKSWADHAPWREYYMTRNEIFTIWTYYPDFRKRMFVLYRLAQHAVGVVLFGKQKIECLRMMFRGFLDGLSGRLGIRFLPNGKRPTQPIVQSRNDALSDCA